MSQGRIVYVSLDCVISIGVLLNELLHNKGKSVIPIKCYIDNNDLFQAIHSDKDVSERRLRREINGIKESIKKERHRQCLLDSNE